MSKAFVFPGQGSQAVGMGKALAESFAEARAVFEEVDDAIGQNLTALMFEGPEDQLTLTENAQPALMAVSLAVIRVLEGQGDFDLTKSAAFVAGHSLGEYSALAAAGAISVADTARLLKIRGRAMQKAVPVGEGGMAALIGVELDQANQIAQEAAQGEVCTAANDNGGGQVVLSGHAGAIARAIDIAKAQGVKRALPLPVSAPFHCPLMQPAADAMKDALSGVEISSPAVPLVANVTASAVTGADDIRTHLVEQVTGAVRWRESVLYLKEQGVDTLVECGAGKVLSGLARRIDRKLSGVAIGSPDDIDAFLN